jgi:hypothetical protein
MRGLDFGRFQPLGCCPCLVLLSFLSDPIVRRVDSLSRPPNYRTLLAFCGSHAARKRTSSKRGPNFPEERTVRLHGQVRVRAVSNGVVPADLLRRPLEVLLCHTPNLVTFCPLSRTLFFP